MKKKSDFSDCLFYTGTVKSAIQRNSVRNETDESA